MEEFLAVFKYFPEFDNGLSAGLMIFSRFLAFAKFAWQKVTRFKNFVATCLQRQNTKVGTRMPKKEQKCPNVLTIVPLVRKIAVNAYLSSKMATNTLASKKLLAW